MSAARPSAALQSGENSFTGAAGSLAEQERPGQCGGRFPVRNARASPGDHPSSAGPKPSRPKTGGTVFSSMGERGPFSAS